jgi:hypothetical protein
MGVEGSTYYVMHIAGHGSENIKPLNWPVKLIRNLKIIIAKMATRIVGYMMGD